MTDQRHEPSGRIVTFYSYKGGVDRTMALANSAWILAAAGHRVLLRHLQKRAGQHPGRRPLHPRDRRPPRDVPLDRVLQPPPPPQPRRITPNRHLRETTPRQSSH